MAKPPDEVIYNLAMLIHSNREDPPIALEGFLGAVRGAADHTLHRVLLRLRAAHGGDSQMLSARTVIVQVLEDRRSERADKSATRLARVGWALAVVGTVLAAVQIGLALVAL